MIQSLTLSSYSYIVGVYVSRAHDDYVHNFRLQINVQHNFQFI